MKYNVSTISRIINAAAILPFPNLPISRLETDSRKIPFPEESLFVAISGKQQSGADFLDHAAKKGVRSFIVEELPDKPDPQLNYLVVEDAIQALQKVATYHRKKFDLPIIGITGSNGKTIVKDWLTHVLKDSYSIIRSPKSYNSQIGVPLSILEIRPNHNLGIFEAGISMMGEMRKLEPIIQPHIGVLTNIGPAHKEGFKSHEEKLRQKLNLFRRSETLIYCLDQEMVANGIKDWAEKIATPPKLISWSKTNKKADYYLPITEKSKTTEVELSTGDVLSVPFKDEASVENVLHCIAVSLYLDIPISTFEKNLQTLEPLGLRLEVKEALNDCQLIYDCYNFDLEGLRIALDFQKKQGKNFPKTAILSDFPMPDEKLSALQHLLESYHITKFIGIGEKFQANKLQLKNCKSFYYNDLESFREDIDNIAFSKESILLKGLRKFRFEKLGRILESRAHETVFEVNLNALTNNLSFFRNYIEQGVKVMAMVKAFGYGTGSIEIARLLQFHNINYLGVAYIDEGINLRQAGVTSHIMVMNPGFTDVEPLIKYHLEPEIYSLNQLKRLVTSLNERPLKIHLKIETGFHRLGFQQEDMAELIEILESKPQIEIGSVFSHLSVVENPNEDNFTEAQFKQFGKACTSLSAGLGKRFDRHILNSAGILRFPNKQFEMVRLGIGLYGIDTTSLVSERLEMVGRLKSVVTQIKTLKKGDSLGYGRAFIAKKETPVGIVGIGYADGIPRNISNGKSYFLVNGKKAKILGNICMDMCFVDLSNIEAKEGDEVIIFGPELRPELLASWAETIPYEILAGLSSRIKRIYYEE